MNIKALFPVLLGAAFLVLSSPAEASGTCRRGTRLSAVGYTNFEPFSTLTEEPSKKKKDPPIIHYHGILPEVVEAIVEKAGFECCDYVKADSIQEALDKLGGDAFDLAFGLMRYDSKKAEKFAFVMPPFLSMPVTVATRGDKTFKISSRSDLVDKKGVMFEKENFGPLANGWIGGRLDVEKVPSMHEAFRRIMHGEADYMLSNYYILHAFAVRWGVWDLLRFPHKKVFTTPMYLALPKRSRCVRQLGNFQQAIRAMKAENRIKQLVQEKIGVWGKAHARELPPPELRPPEMMEENASPLAPSEGGGDAGESPLTGKSGAEKDDPAQEK